MLDYGFYSSEKTDMAGHLLVSNPGEEPPLLKHKASSIARLGSEIDHDIEVSGLMDEESS